MINTFYSLGTLNSSNALLLSLLIGIVFGLILEQVGFGSSRRLAAIFYFKDMAVLKVMFGALMVAMITISYFKAFGLITTQNVYFLDTFYLAQTVGGLVFGVGFVMSGWCPGTGAVGLASGKIDAFIFLVGVLTGSILFNELYPFLSPFKQSTGVIFFHNTLGFSEALFVLLMSILAVCCFWGSEHIEKKQRKEIKGSNKTFLKVFSFLLIVSSFGLFAIHAGAKTSSTNYQIKEKSIIQTIHSGKDHISCEELADRILSGDKSITLIDIRTPEEFAKFNIRTSQNIQLTELSKSLLPHKNKGIIVLYSNGMTHPAQARDSLVRQGYNNVYFLTDGLKGFIKKCLRPASLREQPITKEKASKINSWRNFFLK